MTPEQIEALMRKAQQAEPVVIRDFEATYESECETCGEGIEPGERAGYLDGDDRASCWDCCLKAKEG